MTHSIGTQLAQFSSQFKYEDFPEDAIQFAKILIMKTVAGMVAGARFPAAEKITSVIKTRNSSPEVGVIGHGFKASAWESVLALGVFAHASELEDDRFTAQGGGSWDIGVLPVTIALAQREKLSGKAFLEASIVGLEVHCRTCNFPTSQLGLQMVPGAIGPAAGAARALGLDAVETANALGMAMSGPPIISLNFGTDAHYFESAMQNMHAVVAVDAARFGMTANPEIGRFMSRLFGRDRIDQDTIVDGLGSKWYFEEIWVKKYPCCFGTHRQVDSLIELMSEHHLACEQIESVVVDISRVDRVLDRPQPRDLGDLQFSLQYALSAAMVDRDVTLEHFSETKVHDEKYLSQMSKVKISVHDDWPTGTMESPSVITLSTTDGRQFKKERRYAIGSPSDPLSMEQCKQLFRKFTQGILPRDVTENVLDSILNLEKLDSIEELMRPLTFPGNAGKHD
ncbi:MmgE/PrpD family protein [Pollutimonas sp. H1-120]|uniref:MmgE/PrpD family protein n=1 Tax=Pollutimonas sp. H1-120 TaxID=3148824 RepID=UPI003B520C30